MTNSDDRRDSRERYFGIYGFAFTKEIKLTGMRFVPLHNFVQLSELMRERRRLHLTGYGVIEAETVDEFHEWKQVRLLADAMTFAQQRQVETTLLIVLSPGDSIASLVGPEKLGRPLPVLYDRQPYSPCIKDDVWSPGSMTSFLQLFLDRFEVESPSDPLRMAVYRQLEISRLSTPFVELHHFLAFSAL